jgi:HupE / UreJ protein
MRRHAYLPWLLCLCPAVLWAHQQSDAYLHVAQPPGAPDARSLDVQLDLALVDIEHAIGLDDDGDGAVSWGELQAHRVQLESYLRTRLHLRNGADDCPAGPVQLLASRHVDGGYAVLRFPVRCAQSLTPAIPVSIDYRLFFDLDPNHRGLLSFDVAGLQQTGVLSAAAPLLSLDLRRADRLVEFTSFVRQGVWHIWTGFDHLLFLLTLLLPAVLQRRDGRWVKREKLRDALLDIARVVTAFTVSHSLTLALAVLGYIRLPSRWVESAIAVTVLLGALNLLHPVVDRRRWAVALGFGLIHGLGFASVLAEMNLQRGHLLLDLLSFNLGVEAGQLAVVALFLPLAFLLRDQRVYQRLLLPVGACAIASVASLWLLQRLTGAA